MKEKCPMSHCNPLQGNYRIELLHREIRYGINSKVQVTIFSNFFSASKASSSTGKRNWNLLDFLPFIFSLGQCVSLASTQNNNPFNFIQFKSRSSLCGSKTCPFSGHNFGRFSHTCHYICNNWNGLFIKHLSRFENCILHQEESQSLRCQQ